MKEIALKFDQVSKKYRLRHGWYLSLRDEVARITRRALSKDAVAPDIFWALRDVSFEIRRGETVGLIGPNGAGKSTILKILSRVTTPTSGLVSVNGKVGALIEVGAGFHPDLTGRENVYLNGSIMGMRKRELDAKFDQIVAFAEVDKFIDTPLKFYSSGMMVRLGFAVAAHIEPEILLVDEVLAVGDASFQAKCLNKIAELKEQDKTIILVSHNMPSILQHSSRVMWIDHGGIQAFGDPEETAERYLLAVHDRKDTAKAMELTTSSDSSIRITGVTVCDTDGKAQGTLTYGKPATVEITYAVTRPVDDPVIALSFHDVRDANLGGLTTRLDRIKLDCAEGTGVIRLVLSPVLFTRGSYAVTVAIYDARIQRYLDLRPRAVSFMVEGPSVASREVSGHFVFPHRWDTVAERVG